MEIRNSSATPSKLKQLRNVNTIRWKSRNITTQPVEIDDWKSEVIAFVVNAGMNITSNNFYIQIKERTFFVWSICLFNCSSVGYISGICLSNSGLSMVNISSRYWKVSLNNVYKVIKFRFVKVRHKISLIKKNKTNPLWVKHSLCP